MKKSILKFMALTPLVFAASLTLLSSCTDAEKAKIGGYGDSFKVEVVNCDGSVTHSWISSGKVISEANTDGYYFEDKATGKLIEVTGNLIITKQ